LHSKTEFRHFYPLTEFIGIFITAWAIALSYGLHGQFDANTILLFLSTLGYYALDHGLDLIRFQNTSLRCYLRAYMALFVLSACVFGAVVFYAGIMESLRIFMLRFWPTLLIAALYFLVRRKTTQLFLLIKCLLISLGVGFAVSFPFLHPEILIAPLVCLSNVLVFAFLERNKDAELGNANLFHVGFKKNYLVYGLVIVSAAGIIMQWVFDFKGGFGLAIYAFLSFMILINETKFRENTYRWWLDALLPVAFLPLG
jgi:hypothetical protein